MARKGKSAAHGKEKPERKGDNNTISLPGPLHTAPRSIPEVKVFDTQDVNAI